LELNSIYPRLMAALKKASGDSWILTTKKVDFAFEIALAGGLEWNRDKIICSGTDRKLDIIGEILGDSSGNAIFVDDQIDHFGGPVDTRIQCYLADWGYIENEWLNMGYDVLSQDKFIALLNSFF
ncbi:MAG: hypothetical protein HN368_00115, partial [Spirochaetales bacterium]|nr:hypothetical protein [Spirochaetales bacterium]